ncbi:uncharacterized protein LOC101853596 isoform X2 [Aplysia californica]|uniref:Uncharacterized protein LOC101853596 isoform X2 n=1 Tax=Aplysia californica TaxID=6500 RepID=A0ABM0JBI8_APLCA|nr:uncharacterized protein LOC101853596 isoform X2 [Aplysia californica]
MSRKPYGTYQYTPTAGVRADFKRLMNSFLSQNTVRYEVFSEIWREKNMSYICACRSSDREAREFMERIFVIALEYFLPPFQFQVRVGGLYLLYALFQIQPVVPKVKIRLTRSQWEDSLFLKQQAALQSHLDVVYIFNRLLCEHAFLFCLTAAEMSMPRGAVDVRDDEESLADELREERSSINSLFNYESMEQLSYLQDQYRQMKIGLSGPEATKPNKSLNVVNDGLVEDLILMLQSFRTKVSGISKYGKRNDTHPVEEVEVVESTGNRRSAIKAQAYSQVSTQRSRKTHVVVVEEEAGSSSVQKSPQKHGGVENMDKDPLEDSSREKQSGNAKLNMPVFFGDLSSDEDEDDEDYLPPIKMSRPSENKSASTGSMHKMKSKQAIRNRIEVKMKWPENEPSNPKNVQKDNDVNPDTCSSPKRKQGRPRKGPSFSPENFAKFQRLYSEKLKSQSSNSVSQRDSNCDSSEVLKVRISEFGDRGLNNSSEKKLIGQNPPRKIYVKEGQLFKSISFGPNQTLGVSSKNSQNSPEQIDPSDDDENEEVSSANGVSERGLNFAQAVSNLTKKVRKTPGHKLCKPPQPSFERSAMSTEELLDCDLPQTTHIVVKGYSGKGKLDVSAIARAVKSKGLAQTRPNSRVQKVEVKILQQKDTSNSLTSSAQPRSEKAVKRKGTNKKTQGGFDLLFSDFGFVDPDDESLKDGEAEEMSLSEGNSGSNAFNTPSNDKKAPSSIYVKPVQGRRRKWASHFQLCRPTTEQPDAPDTQDTSRKTEAVEAVKRLVNLPGKPQVLASTTMGKDGAEGSQQFKPYIKKSLSDGLQVRYL